METVTGCFLLVLLSCVSAEDKFVRDGGTLELNPNAFANINSITWKHKATQIITWERGAQQKYDAKFEGRTALNTSTGTLEITKMGQADTGNYSVYVNNALEPEIYSVKVIKEVPQPAVVMSSPCSTASKSCILLCDRKADEAVTVAEAEPVTYSWKEGDGAWEDGEKNRTITNDEKTQLVKTFSCRMKNPFSEKESDPVDNAFNGNVKNPGAHSGAGGSVPGGGFLLLLISAVVLGAGF